jgi:glycosyltransferase involved in cell wall biosynthesis
MEVNYKGLDTNLTFSVITPSFNQGSFLEDTLLSVVGQNYPKVQHIVIDGGSTDHSVTILRKHTKQLSFWVSEPDDGQSQAINKGLKHATGDIVMWLNSDDVLMPNSFNKVNNYFATHPDTDFLHGRSVFFGEGRKDLLTGDTSDDLAARYLAYIPFPQPSSFFRRSLIEKIGNLNEKLHFGMDHEFLVRAFLMGSTIRRTEEVLSKYRLHPLSKTNDILQFPKDWAEVFSKVLRSAEAPPELFQIMKSTGLYHDHNDTFEMRREISAGELKKALLYHLLIQAHYHYNASDLKKTRLFLAAIRETDPIFYEFNDLKLLAFKSKFLLPSVIQLLRNLTRK